jgi:hypothetical protein
MKQVSLWAKHHVWQARILIIVSHVLLTIITIYWSVLGFKKGWLINEAWLYVLIGVYCSIYFIYPSKANKNLLKNTYRVRTLLHAAMTVCSLMLVFSFVNVKMQPLQQGYAFAANTLPVTIGDKGYKNPEAEKLISDFKAGKIKKFTKKERQILRAELTNQVKNYKDAKANGRKDEAGNAAIIILTIVLALVLLYGVAALSCSLSCDGNDGAAVIVLVLGLAAVVFGVILVIRGVKKKKHAAKKPETA